nr:hypothetical protein [uncultured Methanospirillum sp.]
MGVLPASAADTLSGDDTKFITDITKEGLPLLSSIPDIMKDGFFNGNESTLQTVNKEQIEKIDAFVKKINEYKLSEKVTPVRSQFINSTEIFKTDLTEYSTLTNSCGSCVTKINEMYPKLLEEANKTGTLASKFD